LGNQCTFSHVFNILDQNIFYKWGVFWSMVVRITEHLSYQCMMLLFVSCWDQRLPICTCEYWSVRISMNLIHLGLPIEVLLEGNHFRVFSLLKLAESWRLLVTNCSLKIVAMADPNGASTSNQQVFISLCVLGYVIYYQYFLLPLLAFLMLRSKWKW
jgi:hypothetical protein